MTVERQDSITETSAVSEAEELAAMEAVFDNPPEEQSEAGVSADQEAPAEQETTTEGEPSGTEEEPPVKEPTYAELLAAIEAAKNESKAEISRVHDRAFGKIGELQQKIDAIRATANFSPKAKEKLQTDFPELAELLFDNEPIPAHVQTQQPAPAPMVDVDAIVSSKLEEANKLFERKLLKTMKPNWESLVESPDFGAWVGTLPPESAAELNNSWDAHFLNGKLTEFEQWQQAQAEKAKKEEAKKERLSVAVIPQGLPRGAHSVKETDEELEALNRAFGRRQRY